MNEPAPSNITSPFDYAVVDTETSEFLQQKAINIEGLYHKARFDIGKELKAAQEKLSKHGYGCFVQWVESVGFKFQRAYELIDYYDLIFRNSDKQDLIEGLPKTLAMAISKNSAPTELKQAVLNGDITTHKEYQDLLKAQKEAECQAQEAERRAQEAENAQTKISFSLDKTYKEKQEAERKIEQLTKQLAAASKQKTVEVIPDHVKLQIKSQYDQLEQAKLKLTQFESSEQDRFERARRDAKLLDQEGQFLASRINAFLADTGKYPFIADVLMKSNSVQLKDYDTALTRLETWLRVMRGALPACETTFEMEVLK